MKTSSVLNVYGVLDGEGVDIESKSMMYATTQSYVNPATLAESAWSREYPSSIAEGTWLHTRTILIYTDGNSTTTYMSAYMGKNGKDAFVIDLTNDADLFTTDSSGKTTFEQTRDTQVRLFLGAAKQTLTNVNVSLSNTSAAEVVTASTSGAVRVKIKNNVTVTDTIVATITATCSYGTLSIDFTLNPVKSGSNGDSPEIWQLAPSLTELSFARDTDGTTLKPTSLTLSVNAKKTVGTSTTEYTSNVSGVSYKWGYDESGESGSGNIGDSLTFTSANAQAHHAVWLELFVNGTRTDRETIPFVIDGRKGNDGDHGKYYKKQYAIGNSRTNHPTSGWQDTQPTVTDANPYLWERSRLWNPNTNDWDAGSSWIYVCLSGRDGRPGDLGPMCYIAGEYSDSQTYVRDTATGNTVAVEVPLTNGTSQIWVLEADSNVDADTGTHYRPSNDPDVNPGVWSMGLNSYNLIRTRYLFADFAKLGSGVVSGDWLYSACGTINGTLYADNETYQGLPGYMWFEAAHANDDIDNVTRTVNGSTVTGHNFIPGFAVDLLTGRVYMQAAYVAGTIKATDGNIGAFEIGQSWLGNVVQEQGSDIFTGCKIFRNGQLIIGNDILDYVLRAFGGIELNGNGKGITINVSVGSSASASGHKCVNIGRYIKVDLTDRHQEGSAREAINGLAVNELYLDGYGFLRYKVNDETAPLTEVNSFGQIHAKTAFYREGYRQINVKTSAFTLPSNPPDGTIFLLKGLGGSLTVTTRNAPILHGDTNDVLVAENSSFNFGAVGVMLFYIASSNKWAQIYSA